MQADVQQTEQRQTDVQQQLAKLNEDFSARNKELAALQDQLRTVRQELADTEANLAALRQELTNRAAAPGPDAKSKSSKTPK